MADTVTAITVMRATATTPAVSHLLPPSPWSDQPLGDLRGREESLDEPGPSRHSGRTVRRRLRSAAAGNGSAASVSGAVSGASSSGSDAGSN